MAVKTVIDILINASQSAKTLGELEGSVEQLKEQIKGVEVGSKEFNRMAGAIQTAESRVKTLNKTFEGLEPQQIADSFAKVGEAMVGSFAAAQGAAILFGKENEDIQESMMKAQAALSLAIGARQIAEGALQARIAARAVTEKVATLATSLNTAAQSKNVVVKGAATAAQWALNAAMNANPIMLLITGLGALVGALVLFGDEADNATAANDRLTESFQKTDDVIGELQATFDHEIELMKLRGKDERIIRMRQLEQAMEINAMRVKAERDAADNYKEAWKSGDLEVVNSAEKLWNEAQTKLLISQRKIQLIQEGGRLDDRTRNKEHEDKLAEEARKREEERTKAREKQQEEDRKWVEDQRAFDIKNRELRGEDERTHEQKMLDFHKEKMKEGEALKDQVAYNDSERRRISLEQEQANANARILLASSIGQSALALAEIMDSSGKKAATVQKAVTLAQIAFDTAAAISALTKNSEANPANAVTGGIAGIAQFAAGLGRILANIAMAKKILSSAPSVGGGGGGSLSVGGGAGGGGFTRPPDIGTRLGEGGEINQPPPVKVFVTESDISDKQGRVNRVSQRATVE